MRAVQTHADRLSQTPTAPEPETPFLERLHLPNSRTNGMPRRRKLASRSIYPDDRRWSCRGWGHHIPYYVKTSVSSGIWIAGTSKG
ncbi:hypothetical protein CGCSCA1_v007934 [Colletotrichum siamense]|nr:hypothetical protein CGCSCA1_v007934 [Colletotrichum siamense]